MATTSTVTKNDIMMHEEAPEIIPAPVPAVPAQTGGGTDRLGGKVVDAAVDLTKEALEVGEDMCAAVSLLPRDGYELRNRLIAEDDALSTEQKLAESYRNDDHYIAGVERMCSAEERMRDNKTKNLGWLVKGGTCAFIAVVAYVAGNKEVRTKVLTWITAIAA